MGTADYRAVVSAKPNIRLKFCTAAPEAPLIRLSRQLMITTRSATRRAVTSQKFVPCVSLVAGKRSTTRTNGWSA